MKKGLSLVSTLIVLMLLLSACSSNDEETRSPGTKTEGTIELTVAFPLFGAVPKDLTLVQDQINKIAQEKINVNVKLLPIGFGDWQQQTNLMFSSNEKLDLIPTVYNYSSLVSKGQLVALDDLLEKQGQGITQALDQTYLDAAKVKGSIYGVPTLRDMATTYGIAMRKDLVDKYKIDVDKIQTLQDVEQVLKTVKAGEPDISPLVPGAIGASILGTYQTYDTLGDQIGVLPGYDNHMKVANLYETEEYMNQLQMVRKWYEEGLILKDAATNKTSQYDLIRSKRAFAYLLRVQPQTYDGETQTSGVPMKVATFSKPVSTTSTITNVMWGIPVNSKTPDKAMEFLNLMYTNKDIANLLIWGIEGKHYVVKSGNVIDFPQGVDSQNSGYYLNMGWLFGNQFLSYVFNGQDPDIWDKIKEFNKSAVNSKALGFSFDSSPVKVEFASVGNVISQYAVPLETGSVNPDEILPDFIAKLKSAGIDKILMEKQKQLDEWVKSNK
ncbi:ABC transporter substrate-binding protein [Paenibacillus sp. 276b]|uniref:ABC transporter substrate-binding protein n=1 Tax=Paenibacillus sp. 276b TaxID=1566277 RepID=UPI0008965CE4|nr:ABC transporter substrate-binding protein [Paenibacillus sp. 276b]SEA60889.1 putative aldouronate transport system substrate-binding protein [Paenibacillus sp. 276b]